jgi:hypothetical protein
VLVEASIARVQLTARTFARSSAPFGQPLSEWQSDAANARNCPSEPAVAGRDNGVDFSGVWRPYSLDRASGFSHQERLKAASAERTMSQWPAPKKGHAKRASIHGDATQREARFGRQSAAWPQQVSLLAKRT